MTDSRGVWGFLKSHPAAVAIGLIAGGLAIAALVFFPPLLVDISGGGGLKGRSRVQAIANERRTVLAALAGLAAVVGLIYTALKHQLDRDTHTLDRDSNVTERYTLAIEQLGHDSTASRLGGLYSLDRIAFDSERDRDTILQVICAFVRDRTRTQDSGPPDTDVAAALALLTRKTSWISSISSRMDLHGATLLEANFYGANLTNANLVDADLRGATLDDADLSGANLFGANLTGATLENACFKAARLVAAGLISVGGRATNFEHARLDDANLTDAVLHNANFHNANLTNANLKLADLVRAIFLGADLTSADLTSADLTNANLTEAVLVDANLTNANLTNANLRAAIGLVTAVGLRET